VEFPFTYDIQKITGMPLSVKVTPYYEYWGIRESNQVYAAWAGGDICEPDSTTNQVGVIAGIVYEF